MSIMAKKHKRPVRRSHGLSGTKEHHAKAASSDVQAAYLSLEHAASARTCGEKVRWLSHAFAYLRLRENELHESGAPKRIVHAAAKDAASLLKKISSSPCVKKGK